MTNPRPPHAHGYAYFAHGPGHRDCELVAWQCVRCGRAYDHNPRYCYNCEFVVFTPLWLEKVVQ